MTLKFHAPHATHGTNVDGKTIHLSLCAASAQRHGASIARPEEIERVTCKRCLLLTARK